MDVRQKGSWMMATTIPIIVTNTNILVKRKGRNEFLPFNIENIENIPNVPFYHHYAKKLDESVTLFKAFLKSEYGTFLPKPVLAIIIPDDTTELERAFLQSFFSNVSKAVAISLMSQTLSSENLRYISVSRTERSIALQYISDGNVLAERYYDVNTYDAAQIKLDAARLHIDADDADVPVFVNNLSGDMLDFMDMGEVIFADTFRRSICDITVEKI